MLRMSRMIGIGFLLITLLTFVAKVAGAPVGNSLANVPLGPERPPIELTFWYSTEKREWLETAVARFEASNPTVGGRPIKVRLVGFGSREMALRVANEDWRGEAAPTVISPASSIQIDLLAAEWAARRGGSILAEGADAPQPTVITPLVLAAWEQRAQLLWPNGPQADNFWQNVHDALTDPQGWQGRGGSAQWGYVKWGHTSPVTSNSGTQTLLLLAYGYHNKARGLSTADIADAGFQQWLIEIEQTVSEFGDSTGTFMTNMVQFGPSTYDFVAVYENIALENAPAAQNRWGQHIRIYYPPVTLFSDHPYAMLTGSWITSEQTQAARVLREFLLSESSQRLALESGFRPANAAVPITSDQPNNPFVGGQALGVQVEVEGLAETPSAEVVEAMVDLWAQRIGR